MRQIAVITFLVATVCCAQAAESIKLVSSLPRSGGLRSLTQSIVNGIRMAIDDAGGSVKLGDTSYVLAYEDWDDASPARGGSWDPSVEKDNAMKAVADGDVVVYLGTFNSGAAKMSMPILNQAGLAMISSANTAPALTKPETGDKDEPARYRPSGTVNYFRVVPADDIQGAAGALWAKDLGATKVFVLHDKEAYGESLAGYFKSNAEKLGLAVAGFEGVDVKAANFRPLATKIRSSGADLVFYGGTVDTRGGQLAKDLHAAGIKAKLILPDGCFTDSLLTSAGAEALNGRVFITFGGVPADQLQGRGQGFAADYRKRFGIDPESYAAYGYEAASVAIDAMRRAGRKDRAAVLAALAQTRDFAGVLGTWSFDANGDTTLRTVSGNVVTDGKFVFSKILGQ
jgi:branched-chain amino acid transport system substrate-binding protein